MTAFGEAEVQTLSGLPDLELYLPIDGQLARWAKGEPVDVAVRQSPSEDYRIFTAEGSVVDVPESYDPRGRLTLVLARSEIDYRDSASALRGGSMTGGGGLREVTVGEVIAREQCYEDCGGGVVVVVAAAEVREIPPFVRNTPTCCWSMITKAFCQG